MPSLGPCKQLLLVGAVAAAVGAAEGSISTRDTLQSTYAMHIRYCLLNTLVAMHSVYYASIILGLQLALAPKQDVSKHQICRLCDAHSESSLGACCCCCWQLACLRALSDVYDGITVMNVLRVE